MKLAKKYRTRLTRLADKLEGAGPYLKVGPVPKEKFNLDDFFKRGWNPEECGFAACAVGWALTDKWFQNHGLGYDDPGTETFWFGQSDTDTWRHLFVTRRYPSPNPRPATVAKRIRKLVEDST